MASRAAWREVEKTTWDGIGLGGVDDEEVGGRRDVRVIGRRRGWVEGEREVRRDESL